MALLAGFVYYFIVFLMYCAGIFGAVKLGIFWRKRTDAKKMA